MQDESVLRYFSSDKWSVGREENRTTQSDSRIQEATASNEMQDKWEEQVMIRSGVMARNRIDYKSFEETAERSRLQIHNTKPNFLDGKVFFSVQKEQVLTVQDPTSDIAVLSKKGSSLCSSRRLVRDRNKIRKRFGNGGTRMGNLLGVEKYC